MENNINLLKLTQTVQKGGCAAKVPAVELRKILNKVNFPTNDSCVMIDGGLFDDAAIYKVNEDLALVQTLDFFTPIVDSPRYFGRVASANALSDVYAMGGMPKTALAILAFPLSVLDNDVAVEVLQGCCDVLKQAKVNFVGGHSIDDDSLKFGLSVTGYVHPKKVWSNAKAQVGDLLILTKPLGTGTACAALKKGEISEEGMSEVIESMSAINNVPEILSEVLKSFIHGATDITGFGLVGHAMQMAQASSVSFSFKISQLPVFELSQWALEKGFLTKAHKTNLNYVEAVTDWGSLTELQKLLCCDPQTSGGLLLSVSKEKASILLSELQKYFPKSAIVGSVHSKQEKILQF